MAFEQLHCQLVEVLMRLDGRCALRLGSFILLVWGLLTYRFHVWVVIIHGVMYWRLAPIVLVLGTRGRIK